MPTTLTVMLAAASVLGFLWGLERNQAEIDDRLFGAIATILFFLGGELALAAVLADQKAWLLYGMLNAIVGYPFFRTGKRTSKFLHEKVGF